MDWDEAVARVIRSAPATDAKHLDVIDDVVAGRLDAAAIKAKHGGDLVIAALAHVTRTLHRRRVPPIAQGGWRDPARHGGFYKVAPAFAAAWTAARGLSCARGK